MIADDRTQTTDQLAITVDLVRGLTQQYRIDLDRLYNTGQSMGGMISIAMDIEEPTMFAASLLVSCQWDPTLVGPLAGKPLWSVVSEGDLKPKPRQQAILGALQARGATVSQATCSAEASPEAIQSAVSQLASQRTSIHQTIYPGGNHPYPWHQGNSTAGVRDWLFPQSRTPSPAIDLPSVTKAAIQSLTQG